MDGWVDALTLVTGLGSGLVAGLLFSFSVMVMPALRGLPPEQGIAAMQRIDKTVANPLFGLAYGGTLVLSAVSVVVAVLRWSEPGAVFLLAGGLLYLANFAITAMVHLPRNATLQKTDPAGEGSAHWWAGYMATWTRWNHVRTVAALAAAAAFTVSLG